MLLYVFSPCFKIQNVKHEKGRQWSNSAELLRLFKPHTWFSSTLQLQSGPLHQILYHLFLLIQVTKVDLSFSMFPSSARSEDPLKTLTSDHRVLASLFQFLFHCLWLLVVVAASEVRVIHVTQSQPKWME